jgi:hypothetical protein
MIGHARIAGREMHAVARGTTKTHHRLRRRIIGVVVITLMVDVVGTLVIFLFEHNAEGTKITNIGDSAFWTTTQLLTVSSQLPNPISTGGRIFDVFLQFWAISVVAVLAGSFGDFFRRRTEEIEGEREPQPR